MAGPAMLQDLANSKRVATVVHANRPELSDLKATIVSELFWPPFHGDDVKLPLEVMPPSPPPSVSLPYVTPQIQAI